MQTKDFYPQSVSKKYKSYCPKILISHCCIAFAEFYRNPESITAYEADWVQKTEKNFGLSPSANNVTDVATKIRHFYFPLASSLPLEDKLDRYKRMFSDGLFNFHMHTVASIQRQFSPVYLYHFNLKGGPSLASLLVNIRGKMAFLLEVGWAFLKQFFNNVLFQQKPKELGTTRQLYFCSMLSMLSTCYCINVILLLQVCAMVMSSRFYSSCQDCLM